MAESLTDYYSGLQGYSVLDPGRRVKGPPSKLTGYKISPTRGNEDDSARYILIPDVEFYRPWLANPPGGSAFIWPLGIQGFTYTSTAQLGIHHYIGDNDVDIDVVYPDEQHVTLSGHFPGKTSVSFLRDLRQVILDKPGKAGKVLSLPGVEEIILYVVVSNYSFSHQEDDNTSSIAYSVEFVKVGEGAKLDLPILQKPTVNPKSKKAPKGKSQKQTRVKHGSGSTRKVAKKVYGSSGGAGVMKLLSANANDLEEQGIPLFTAAFTPLNGGQLLKF